MTLKTGVMILKISNILYFKITRKQLFQIIILLYNITGFAVFLIK